MILDGKKIADEITASLQNEVAVLRQKNSIPGLGILLIGDDPASQLYVSMKEKMAQTLGMKCILKKLPGDVSEQAVIEILNAFNLDVSLHGIMIQVPVPKHLSLDSLSAHIDLAKDIDCLNPQNMMRLENGDVTIRPPTAESVAQLIKASGAPLTGAGVAVVGSGFFARQITYHLRNLGFAAEQIPFRSDELLAHTTKADVVVSAVGRAQCITADMIREGAIVIDVGVTRINGDVVGDVDFTSVSEKAGAITPVPGGVGPVTVAVLLENVVHAAQALTNE